MPAKRRVHRTSYWRLIARRWLPTAVCSLAIATSVFGLGGFGWQYAVSGSVPDAASADEVLNPPTDKDWSIPFFKTVQLFLLNSGAEDDSGHPSNWLLMIARLSAAILFLLVSSTVIVRVLDEVIRLPNLLMRRNHVVICGLGKIGMQLLEDLHSQKRAHELVIIEIDPTNRRLDYAKNLGATVLIGDSTQADTLVDARATQAAEVFVVNGDDGVNLEVTAELDILAAEETRNTSPLKLYVHIDDVNFATTLRPYCKILHDSSDTSVQVFNVSRTAATRLVTQQLWEYAPKTVDEVAHFVILGFGEMGQTLAVQLAQLGHFPNRKRSRFTIADCNITHSARSFLSRYPRFTSWTNGENGKLGVPSFEKEADSWSWNEHPLPNDLRVESAEAIQYVCNSEFVDLPSGRSDESFAIRIGQMFTQPGVKPVVFICGQQDRDNFEMAVQLRDQLTCQGHQDVPIFMWLPRQPALADTLSRTHGNKFIPFGEYRSAASYWEITDPIREKIGEKIHHDYERQATQDNEHHTIKPWPTLEDGLRESNRVAADHLIIKLAALGLRLCRTRDEVTNPVRFDRIKQEEAQLLAEMEHNRWVAERLLTGWRHAPQGATKQETAANKSRNLNHNLVPWDRLKGEQKKDFDLVKTVLWECQKDRFCVEPLSTQAT